MTRAKKLSRIVWAVDPFEKNSPLREHVASAVRCLVEKTHTLVEPVYVLTPTEMNISVEFAPAWMEQYRPAAEAALKEWISELNIPEITEPTVIVQDAASIRNAVKLLCRHAEREQAGLIIAGTHARGGVARFLMGSFAETLVLSSHLPVLTVGPSSDGPQCFDKILFPSDLGEHSRSCFEYVVGMAAQFEASVKIFHTVPSPVEPIFQSGVYLLGGGWIPVHSYIAEETERRRKQLQAWSEWATKRGVKTEFVINEQAGNIVDSIVEMTHRERFDLVMMASQTGPIVSALVGSVTRQVVRHAHCPVWIIHPTEILPKKQAA